MAFSRRISHGRQVDHSTQRGSPWHTHDLEKIGGLYYHLRRSPRTHSLAHEPRSEFVTLLVGIVDSQLPGKKSNKINGTDLRPAKGQMEKREESGWRWAGKRAGDRRSSQRIPLETPPILALRATKNPNRSRLGFCAWWARRDLNPGPKDYAYHYGFRRLWRVCGLDYTFPLQAGRLVSTPSPLLSGAWLGIGVARGRQLPPNLTSSTRRQRVLPTGNP